MEDTCPKQATGPDFVTKPAALEGLCVAALLLYFQQTPGPVVMAAAGQPLHCAALAQKNKRDAVVDLMEKYRAKLADEDRTAGASQYEHDMGALGCSTRTGDGGNAKAMKFCIDDAMPSNVATQAVYNAGRDLCL